MIVWDGGRCVEGFCLALPADVTMASDPDEYGLAYATVDEGIELGLIDGRVCSIRVSGSVFFEGDELIGDDLHRVAARLFEEITEEQELILPNGSMLTTVGGRRRDFSIEVWATTEAVSTIQLRTSSGSRREENRHPAGRTGPWRPRRHA